MHCTLSLTLSVYLYLSVGSTRLFRVVTEAHWNLRAVLLFKHQGNMSEWRWEENKKKNGSMSILPPHVESHSSSFSLLMSDVYNGQGVRCMLYAGLLEMRESRTDRCLCGIRQGCQDWPWGHRESLLGFMSEFWKSTKNEEKARFVKN